MEEVEQHIISTFKQLDCSFSDELTSFSALSTEDVCEAIVRALWSIDPTRRSSLPSCRLPPSITSRFRVATNITDALKAIGVSGDFGYQTLLYGSSTELRRVIISLIEKLPREHVEMEHEELSPRQLAFADLAATPLWEPLFCRRLHMTHQARLWYPRESSPDLILPTSASLWHSVATSDPRDIARALLLRPSASAFSHTPAAKPPLPTKPSLKPALAPKPNFTAAHAEPSEEKKRFEQLTARYNQLMAEVEAGRANIQEDASTLAQLLHLISAESARQAAGERLAALVDNPQEGADKIEQYMEQFDDKMHRLQAKWDESRAAIEHDIATLRDKRGAHLAADDMAREAAADRALAEQLMRELAAKEVLERKLTAQLDRLDPDSLGRAHFTKRIMELIGSVAKLQAGIDKIISENTSLQKNMQWTQQTLDRTFAVIEDALYADVDKSFKCERAYKLFSEIHQLCSQQLDAMERAGQHARKIENLTNQLELAAQSDVSSQLARISADLAAVRDENARIEAM